MKMNEGMLISLLWCLNVVYDLQECTKSRGSRALVGLVGPKDFVVGPEDFVVGQFFFVGARKSLVG